MRRAGFVVLLLLVAVVIPLTEVSARNARRGALTGGATGAIVGGIAGGGRGALIGTAIGAGTGAIIGNDMQRRRRNFYWYNGRCWQRSSRGEFFPVANRYCR
jgi:uncharacterized protein YcfJ